MQNCSFRVASNPPRLAVDRRGSAGCFPPNSWQNWAERWDSLTENEWWNASQTKLNPSLTFRLSLSLSFALFFPLNTPLKLKASLVPSTEEWMHAESFFSLSFFFPSHWDNESVFLAADWSHSFLLLRAGTAYDCQIASWQNFHICKHAHTQKKCPPVPFCLALHK